MHLNFRWIQKNYIANNDSIKNLVIHFLHSPESMTP